MIPNSKPMAPKETVLSWVNPQLPQFVIPADKIFIVSVRGYYLDTMGEPGKNDRGKYDDAIFVISPFVFASFNANTDPSRTFRQGLATLVSPQVVTYVPGIHGYGRSTQHRAFRQASDVIVKRDGGTGNGTHLGNGLFKDSANDRFWINLHKGGRGTTSSEGCQTVPPDQWPAFHLLVLDQMKRCGQDTFQYALVDEPRIAG